MGTNILRVSGKLLLGWGILLNVGVFIYSVTTILSNPYAVEPYEENLLAVSYYLHHGIIPENLSTYPYYEIPYPIPLLYLVSLFPEAWQLNVGRSISILAFLGCCLVIYHICRRLGYTKYTSLWCSSLPFLLTLPRTWCLFYRVDTLAVFLTLLGVYLWLRGNRWLFILPLIGAFWVKQSSLVAIIVILLWIVLREKDWHRAEKVLYLYLGVNILVGLAVYGLCGQLVLRLVDQYPLNFFQLEYSLFIVLLSCPIILLPACRTLLGRNLSWLQLYFGAAIAFAVISSLRAGSGPSYYIEALLVGCILLGEFSPKRWWKGLLLGQAILALLLPYATYTHSMHTNPKLTRLEQRLEVMQGELILTEEASVVLRSGNTPVNLVVGEGEYSNHSIDYTTVTEQIERKEFAAVVIKERTLEGTARHGWIISPELLQAIQDNYGAAESFEPYLVLLP